MSPRNALKWAAATAAAGLLTLATAPVLAAHAHTLSATTHPTRTAAVAKAHAKRLTHVAHATHAKHLTTTRTKTTAKRLTHKPKTTTATKHKTSTTLDKRGTSTLNM